MCAAAMAVVLGLYFLHVSRAATVAIPLEAEKAGSLTSPAATTLDADASGGKAVRFAAPAEVSGSCAVTDKLVNPCRPWLSAAASNYGGMSNDSKTQLLYHESLIGRQLDMVHTYHSIGSNKLSAADIYFVNRPNTLLFTTWKPASNWAAAASTNDDGAIDSMAASIKAVAPKKIIFSVWHEPENDISGGIPCAAKGSKGTPADYVNMWHHVRQRFDADGVNNVVWAINYMGFKGWNDCAVKALWPGNSYVDWVFWDPYSHDGNYDAMVSTFYDWMLQNSDATHDFKSKVWGVAEWNIWHSGTTRQQHIDLYNGAKTSVEAAKWPLIKAYSVFDALENCVASDPCTNKSKAPPAIDQGVLGAYKAYANSPAFTNR